MDIQETLRNHNPFASTAAANPWANAMPDIESLNHEAAEQIFNLALNKLRNPQSPMAGLILGEAGSGKTHMLRRVLDRIRRSGADVVFVCVKAFTLPQKVMRDLWREVFVSLTRERGDGFTQLEFIAAGMTGIYRGQASGEAGTDLDETGCVRYFQSVLPEARGDFLRALLACRRRARKEEAGTTVWGRLKTLMGGSAAREEERRGERKRLEEESLGKRRRDAALRWLQGEIDDEHPRLLGVGDRAAMPPAELEAEAKDWLLSLGLVLDRCGISMTVCFDQLDGMDDPALIGAWEKALAVLVNDVYGMLPLVFVKAATWRRRFSALDESLEQRLTGNRFQLKNCTLEQARELVRARVAAFHPGNGEAGEIAAWLLERLEGKLKNGSPPRVVLDLANRAVVQSEGAEPAAPESAAEVLAEAYREERQKVRDDLDAWPPDADRLLIALETHLVHRGDFEDIRRPEGKYISLTALRAEDKKEDSQGVPCAFIINTTVHSKTVEAALTRGITFLRDNPGGFCLYVSDERCAFPGPERWKKVHAELGKFRRLKGVTLFLDREDAADWYGLYALLARLNNEDVTVPDAGGGRAAGAGDLALFLRNGFGKDLLAPSRKKKMKAGKEPAKEDSRGPEVLRDLARLAAIGGGSGQIPEKTEPEAEPEPEKERTPDGDEEELESLVRALLRDAPMQMMGTGLLRARLNERGTPVSLDALLEFLGRRTDALAFFPDERSPDRGGLVQMLDD